MTRRRLRHGAWALGIVVVLTGCATRPILPDVDTSALLLEPYPGLEPAIVAASQIQALRAPVEADRGAKPEAAPAPCAIPPGTALHTGAIRAPIRSKTANDDVRALFGGRSIATATPCPGGT